MSNAADYECATKNFRAALRIQPNGQTAKLPTECYSMTFTREGKLRYLTAGFVVSKVEGNTGGFGAVLALLSMMVAVLLCWKGASAWQQMRLNARVVVDAEDGCGREEESDIMFKLSRVLQM